MRFFVYVYIVLFLIIKIRFDMNDSQAMDSLFEVQELH